MTTKRGLLDFGAHGKQAWENMGPAGKRRKIREYFTARGKPDNYQYTPAEAREATNYIKAVDRIKSGDSWVSDGSSFLQRPSSYDETFKYKDPIQEFDYPKFLAEQDSETLDDLAIEEASERTSGIDDVSSSGPDIYKKKYTSNLDFGGLLDSEALDDLEEDEASGEPGPSLLDYDEDLEAFDSSPVSEKSWWEELTDSSGSDSSGSDGKLSPMQKAGLSLITDIFGEKEERPMQVASVVPLAPGRSLDMSKYSTARPKRERYRNMGLLGGA